MQNTQIPVPCGKCPACLNRRASGWSFRLMEEEKRSASSHFITLTYDTAHVPISKNGFMEVRKKDVQNFFKRLRKAQGKPFQIKYYAVGEYGSNTKRPHYHIILFNAKVELIQPAWGLGEIHYGEVNGASVGYTLKYMSKPPQTATHRNDDRNREFSLMSKGLGENYLTPQMKSWHLADLTNRTYCNLQDGKKITMPRYYKDKIYGPSMLPDELGVPTIPNPKRKQISHAGKLKQEQLQLETDRLLGDAQHHLRAQSDLQKFNNHFKSATKNRDKI